MRIQTASLVNSAKPWKELITSPSQTHPKLKRRKNSKLVSCYQNYLIPKADKNATGKENYRPISLTRASQIHW